MWGTKLHDWFHDWKLKELKPVVQPKCGPFDPDSDQQRTVTYHEEICCQCGKTRLRKTKDNYWA